MPATLPDNSQPPIGAQIINVADVISVLSIHHGLADLELRHQLSLRGLSVRASMGIHLAGPSVVSPFAGMAVARASAMVVTVSLTGVSAWRHTGHLGV